MKPTDADLLSYIQNDRKLYSVKHILLLTQDPETGEPLDEAAAAEKKAQAEDLLRQLRESSDPAALFDQLMNDYSEDTGLATQPGRLQAVEAGQMVPESRRRPWPWSPARSVTSWRAITATTSSCAFPWSWSRPTIRRTLCRRR